VCILAFNVQGFRAGVDRVADVLAATDPDVALFNEVVRRPGAALARMTRRRFVFGATRRWRAFGNAILLRDPPTRTIRGRFTFSPPFQRRGFVGALRSDGVLVVATHLGTSGEERVRHVAEFLRAVDGYERVVIGADCNEGAGGPTVAIMKERFIDVFDRVGEGMGETFPADAPLHRIDYVFCSLTLTPSRAAVVPLIASDHLAVVADID
jgi:endonuclease/exonuclease/phosphatase family metal-dependent hydrolase